MKCNWHYYNEGSYGDTSIRVAEILDFRKEAEKSLKTGLNRTFQWVHGSE